jgi:hypothetical protein
MTSAELMSIQAVAPVSAVGGAADGASAARAVAHARGAQKANNVTAAGAQRAQPYPRTNDILVSFLAARPAKTGLLSEETKGVPYAAGDCKRGAVFRKT